MVSGRAPLNPSKTVRPLLQQWADEHVVELYEETRVPGFYD